MNNQDLYEFRMEVIFPRDNFRCQFEGCTVCGADNLELAHRISKGTKNKGTGHKYIKRYLYDNYGLDYTLKFIENNYIHHPYNIVTSCRRHNDNFNCLNNPVEADKIIEKIYKKSLTI